MLGGYGHSLGCKVFKNKNSTGYLVGSPIVVETYSRNCLKKNLNAPKTVPQKHRFDDEEFPMFWECSCGMGVR